MNNLLKGYIRKRIRLGYVSCMNRFFVRLYNLLFRIFIVYPSKYVIRLYILQKKIFV